MYIQEKKQSVCGCNGRSKKMKTRSQIEKEIQVLQSRMSRFTSVQFKSTVAGLILEIEVLQAELDSLLDSLPDPVPTTRTLKLNTPRRAWRAWVAQISPEIDAKHGGFTKEFIEPFDRQFNKKGETSARFKITVNTEAIFQDSDGDYWMFENMEGDIKVISYQEVKYIFSKMA